MSLIRPPAVAGTFYPSDREELQRLVSTLLASPRAAAKSAPKAVVVPHAGYIYSGAIAASAYVRVAAGREIIRRVILLGPAHRLAFSGLALSGADFFSTPLGHVPIDRQVVENLLVMPGVQILERAHAQEHSLEVQLPFLQSVLGDFSLVPIIAGDVAAEEISRLLDFVWGGAETLIVVSSDLSHYRDYRAAKEQDSATSKAIAELKPEVITYHDACGRLPINGLLLAVRSRGMSAACYDLRNSGDTAGDRSRVVGYGAYGFE